MIIGITGNNKDGKLKLSKYLSEFYSFKYVDVDKILDNILKQYIIANKNNKNNLQVKSSLIFKIRNEIDEKLNLMLNSMNESDVIVLDYSLLEDSYAFDRCDLLIKTNSNSKEIAENELELLKKYRASIISSKYESSKYHLEINFDEDWENQLKEYIDYNLKNDTKITVVVPIYNTANYLTRCVNSIISQTYRNLEIILIDDGSTDESLQMCNLLAVKDKRIKVVHQENCGLAETRNRGIELATGEYISFFDSDDYVDNSMLETLLKAIKQTNADVCESSFYIHMKNGDVKDVSCEQKGVKFVDGKLNLINSYSDATILIPAWDKLYKLSSIKDIKFDKNCFKEDSDYIFRLCMAEKTFALVPIPFYHYVKRKSASLTGNKISTRLFTLKDWGENAYEEVLSQGPDYKDAAEKILYNSLVHILRNFMRDYKDNVLEKDEFKDEIQGITNNLINILLNAKDVKKFRKLDEVLSIINELTEAKVIDKEKLPSIEIPCVGILWNSLDKEMMNDAIQFIQERSTITDCVAVDLQEQYKKFIKDIYMYNNEFEGIPIMKAGTLIDKYDSNTIIVLNLIMRVSNYIYLNGMKGFVYSEIAELKAFIRKFFKTKIKDYAYDNIFHLTVDNEEFEYTDEVCKKYIREYKKNKSSVKNYQDISNIKTMYEKTFNDTNTDNIKITILSGGMKNAVYLIENNSNKVVLKIAPKDESKMITVDRNILWWEAKMLKLMEKINFPSPKLLYYDDSCLLCESPYIFMNYIDGKNYLEMKEKMSEEEKSKVEYQLGLLSKRICSIKGQEFFLPSQPNKKFKNNYEFTMNLFELLLENAKSKNINLGENNYDNIRNIIISNKESLNNISNLCLAHTDIWDGNVLIKDGKVSGIVDFSDLYFCDELMTFYFHTIDGITSDYYLKGFDNKKLNYDEKVRIEIYRMYVILKMIVDCELKQYGRFDWMYENLNLRTLSLQKKIKY